jgi:hypothetical protein
MGLHYSQEVHDRRNSLSDFFDHALNLLPSEDAFASLPCLDSLAAAARQESMTVPSSNLNTTTVGGFRSTSIGLFGKDDWPEPTPLKEDVSQSLMMNRYAKESEEEQALPRMVTSAVGLPQPLPRREQCLVVTPTNSCTFSEVTFNPPMSEIETTTNPFDDDPLLDVDFLEPDLDMGVNGNTNMNNSMNEGLFENMALSMSQYEPSYEYSHSQSQYRSYEQY